MALSSFSRTRSSPASSKQLLSPCSLLRFYSCQRTENCSENEDTLDKNVSVEETKPKPSSKTKRAKTMSRLINSRPWSSDLESSLSTLSPTLSKTTVVQTLKLITSPANALQFFKWAQQKGFSHSDQSFFLMLEILGRARNLNAARNLLFSIEKKSCGSVKLEDRFFNSLIRSYGQAGLFQESVKLFETMKSLGVSPSVITFNSLLSILLKRGRTNMAKNLFDEMLATYGVTPDTFTFNILIRGFCMNSMVDEGFHFFKDMSRVKCEPDVITYNTLVDGLCRVGKVDVACNVVKGMGKNRSDLNPNVVTYTTLIRGYCMKQEIDEALRVLEEMISRGLKPNKITYNTLLKGLGEAQKLDDMREILKVTMESGEFIPDTCTFNTLIHAHCQAEKLDEALKVFAKMLELKVPQDSATYSVLIRSLCQQGDYDRAEELFDELSKKEIVLSDTGCRPLVAAYNPIFEHLCTNGKTKKAEGVFRQLMKRGTQDPPSYKTLIMGHCREGNYEAGYELLVLMLRRDFVPDAEIYETLISGLLQKDNPLLAKLTLEKMLRSSHLPGASTFHSILTELLEKGFAKESASLLKLMLENKIRQNITLSTKLMVLLFGSGLGDKAFELVKLLYENGYSLNIEVLVGFLCQKSKLLEACKVLRFSLPKHKSVDIELCNTVITGLSKMGKVLEAFGLYIELVEKGVQQQLACVEDLKTALEVAGQSAEAEFVSKRMPEKQSVGTSSQKFCSGKSRPQRGDMSFTKRKTGSHTSNPINPKNTKH